MITLKKKIRYERTWTLQIWWFTRFPAFRRKFLRLNTISIAIERILIFCTQNFRFAIQIHANARGLCIVFLKFWKKIEWYAMYFCRNGGALAGIIIGTLIGVACLILFIIFCCKAMNKNRGSSGRVVYPNNGGNVAIVNNTTQSTTGIPHLWQDKFSMFMRHLYLVVHDTIIEKVRILCLIYRSISPAWIFHVSYCAGLSSGVRTSLSPGIRTSLSPRDGAGVFYGRTVTVPSSPSTIQPNRPRALSRQVLRSTVHGIKAITVINSQNISVLFFNDDLKRTIYIYMFHWQ